MQIREIISLMNHMKQADISKLEFESGGDVLRLERSAILPAEAIGSVHAGAGAGSHNGSIDGAHFGSGGTYAGAASGMSPGSGLNQAAASDDFDALSVSDAGAVREPEDNAAGWLVRSPVVGIYYASPAPDRDPFIEVGSIVEVGSTLCIIEAMKLMNEVNCNAEGKVLEIYAVNGQRVEYNQPLMRIGG